MEKKDYKDYTDNSKEELVKGIEKAAKKGAKKGARRKGILRTFTSLLSGAILIVFLMNVIPFFQSLANLRHAFDREEPVANHDLTLKNKGIFGFTVADFAEAVLGKSKEEAELIVYSREVSDVSKLTEAGLGGFKIFSKYQYVTYKGTATYTVDLSQVDGSSMRVDNDKHTVTITVPRAKLRDVSLDPEKQKSSKVETGLLAFGDIKLKPESLAKLEKTAIKKMTDKLKSEHVQDEANLAAEHALWKIYQPLISKCAPAYMVEIQFEEE